MSIIKTIRNKFKEVPKEVLVGSAIAGLAIGAVVAIAANRKMPSAVYAKASGALFAMAKQEPFFVINECGFAYTVDSVKNSSLWNEINLSIIFSELDDSLLGMIP